MRNEKKKRRRARRSVLPTALGNFNRKVYRLTRDGAVGSYLSGYDKICNRWERSGFVALFRRLKGYMAGSDLVRLKKEKLSEEFENVGFYEESTLPRSFTDRFAQKFDASGIVRLWHTVKEKILHTSVVMYGVLIFGFALFMLLSQALILLFSLYQIPLVFLPHLAEPDTVLTVTYMAASVVLMAASLVLIFAREASLYAFMMESRITGFVLRRFMGLRNTDAQKNCLKRHGGRAFVVGMILGLITFFVPPDRFFFTILALGTAAVVLHIPEFGLVAITFMLPFFSLVEHATAIAILCCILVLFGTLVKLLRGKRFLKIEPLDLTVIGFLLLLLFGGVVSLGGIASFYDAVVFVLFGIMYFAVTTLIKSSEWLERTLKALMVSALIVSLLGLFEWFLGRQSTLWQDNEVFGAISGRIVSLWENPNVLAEFLLVAVFVSLGCLIGFRAVSTKILALATLLAAGSSLALTWSRGAWVAAAVALVAMLLILSHKTIPLVAVLLIGGAVSLFFLPDSFIARLESIVTFSDSSVLYRLNIWRGCSALIRKSFLTGIGVGEEAFALGYHGFALPGIEAAPHSHNLFMQILIELGLMGLLLFVGMLLLLWRSAFSFFKARSFQCSQSVIALSLLTAVGALLINGLTDYIWYNSRIYLLFWLVIGLITAARRIGLSQVDTTRLEADAYDIDLTIVPTKRAGKKIYRNTKR